MADGPAFRVCWVHPAKAFRLASRLGQPIAVSAPMTERLLTAIYDLAVSPAKYDMIGFLLAAEVERQFKKLDGIRVIIMPWPKDGFRDDPNPPTDPAEKRKMLDNVLFPLPSLMESCISCEVWSERAPVEAKHVFPTRWTLEKPQSCYGTRIIVNCIRAGLMPFHAPEPKIQPETITITLREAKHWPGKNSSRDSWLAAASELSRRGHKITLVPDVGAEPLPSGPWEIDNEAPTDLPARANLYSGARLNLFVNNGPACLAMVMPEVRSVVVRIEATWAICTSAGYFASVGLPKGSRLGRKGHYIAWVGESVREILDATAVGLKFRGSRPERQTSLRKRDMPMSIGRTM